MILKKQFAAIVGVWGAIPIKMEASLKLLRNLKKHVFGQKINQAPPDYQTVYVPKKKASIQAHLIF